MRIHNAATNMFVRTRGTARWGARVFAVSLGVLAIAASAVLFLSSPDVAEEPAEKPLPCEMCHPDRTEGKVVHAALKMGCITCHSAVDASTIPHKMTTGVSKGLMAEPPDLCYMCHDRGKFYGPTIHAPVGVGMCTTCHNPHSTDNEKLLILPKEKLCFMCHLESEKAGKKSVHQPVKEGKCLSCHAPHVRNNEYLLLKKGNILCRKCHRQVEKEAHAVQGYKGNGHPIRGKRDPKRVGKTFGCLSCHVPHTSDWGKLFRYEAASMYDLCLYCHDI